MIDICFSDSLGGMLKVIRKEINSTEIIPLWLDLSQAKLSGDIIENQIKRTIDTAQYFSKNITEQELESEYCEMLESERVKHLKLDRFIESHQPFRLWLSNTSTDRCGLFWFCNKMQTHTNAISVVWCPGYEYDRRLNVSSVKGKWALFDDFDIFIDSMEKAQILSQNEIDAYAREWNRLVTENSNFRILIDNQIVSIPDDFWDNTILRFISHTPQSQVDVMGKIIGKGFGCDVATLSERIDYLISTDWVIVCEEKINENECYWQRTIALK